MKNSIVSSSIPASDYDLWLEGELTDQHFLDKAASRLANLQDSLRTKVEIQSNGCWLWLASKNKKGYGKVGYQNKVVLAHRLFYQLLIGEIPLGLQLDHLCRITSCVNPFHLEPVTASENSKRQYYFNRDRNECLRGHKFTEDTTYIKKGTTWRNCKICDTENKRIASLNPENVERRRRQRKERYHNDPEFRRKALAEAKDRYERRKLRKSNAS